MSVFQHSSSEGKKVESKRLVKWRGVGKTAVLLTLIFIIMTLTPVATTSGQTVIIGAVPAEITAVEWDQIQNAIVQDAAMEHGVGGETAVPTNILSPYPTTQTAKLLPENGTTANKFGDSVAIDGNTIVVGAPDDSLGQYSGIGSAYIFEYSGNEWIQIAKLIASDGSSEDEFGYSVAINGDTVIVGAPFDDDSGTVTGAVYVFEKGLGWKDGSVNQTAKLSAGDAAAYNYFGFNIAISDDMVVVGAYLNQNNGIATGSVYVFEKGAGWDNGNGNQTAKLTASDGTKSDYFGYAVAISEETIVVSSIGDDDNGSRSGSVYVFEKGAGWQNGSNNQRAKLLPDDWAEHDIFGESVAVSGETVVVGAYWGGGNGPQFGSVYLFEKGIEWSDGSANQIAKLTAGGGGAFEGFGYAVAINGDTVLVGAPFKDNILESSSVYVFEKGIGWSSGSANQIAKLVANDGGAFDNFGKSVIISGEMVVIGAVHKESGAAYIFAKDGEWRDGSSNQRVTLLPDGSYGSANDIFGWDIAMGDDTIVISTLNENGKFGSVYVFEKGAEWHDGSINQVAKLTVNDEAYNYFGISVAIDGDTIVVGARLDNDNGLYSGAAYIFEKDTGWVDGNHNQVAKLTASDARPYDMFGWDVAIQRDTVIIGAPNDDYDNPQPGSVYVFEKGAGWLDGSANMMARLSAINEFAGNHFGTSVAISEDLVVIGEKEGSDNKSGIGAVYVFEKGGEWHDGSVNQIAKIMSSDSENEDGFGNAVAIDANTVVIGTAYIHDNIGSAYIFEKGVGWIDGSANQVAKLEADDGVSSDRFGYSVAISGDSVAVGAPGYYFSDVPGSVYLFEKGSGWIDGSSNQIAKLVASDGAASDKFGYSVFLSGENVVVGAYGDDDNGTDSGSAYVFDLASRNKTFLPMIVND